MLIGLPLRVALLTFMGKYGIIRVWLEDYLKVN